MTAYYVEPKSYPTYTATPPNTSTAYDGDGLAKGVANPAYLTVDLTAYTAAAGATIVIGGATLTCVTSGAGANQFNAGSGSTLATNIASAINAATNAVTFAPTGWSTPQLRNVCYGKSATVTLTVQTRCGSASYNSTNSFRLISTGLTGGSQLDVQFANGTSGAWGYLWGDIDDGSSGVMWPSSVAKYSYGVCMVGTTATGPHGPIAGPSVAGAITMSDVINVRCNGKLFQPGADNVNSGDNVYVYRGGLYLFDDGTEWGGDSGYYTINIRTATVYQTRLELNGSSSTGTAKSRVILCNRGGPLGNGLRIKTNTSRGYLSFVPTSTCQSTIDGLLMQDDGNTVNVHFQTSRSQYDFHVRNCKWAVSRNVFYQVVDGFAYNYALQHVTVEGCTFDFSQYTGANSYLCNVNNMPVATGALFFRNNTLVATSTGHTPTNNSSGCGVVVVENCKNLAINQSYGLMGSWSYDGVNQGPTDCEPPWVLQQGMSTPEQFFHENRYFVVQWDPTGAYPTYNAYLPDGTPWSVQFLWSNSANACRDKGIEVFRRSALVTQASQQTVTLELAFDGGITPQDGELGLAVTYTKNSDSKVYTEYSHVSNYDKWSATGTIPTSAASWSGFTGSYSAWVARKLVKTLSAVIKQNTQIDVALIMYKPTSAGAPTKVFINPELGVSA
jgi:hypothetical protein